MAKVAFITGASRGIGKAIGLGLAKAGWNIALAARSVQPNRLMPGTIYSASDEMAAFGVKTLPLCCDVCDEKSLEAAAEKTLSVFGRIDTVIHNAGAIWIGPLEDTPLNRFDQLIQTNVRAAFVAARAFIPTMKKQHAGHLIMIAPPIAMHTLPNKIPYLISKYGMALMVSGLAEEFKGTPLAATGLWPKSVIESQATINFNWGNPSVWRKPNIMADAVQEILKRPTETNGKSFLDEDFLSKIGCKDFQSYLCEADGKPMLMPF